MRELPKLHRKSAVWEQAAAYLRTQGLNAPTKKSDFNAWILCSNTASALLLREFTSAAVELDLEVAMPAAIADLRANPPDRPSIQLGRQFLDMNLTDSQFEALLVDRPEVLATVQKSINAWKADQTSPERFAAATERLKALEAENLARQQRVRAGGLPIGEAYAREREAAERALLQRAKQMLAAGELEL
jgi:hypothetical protein